MGIWLEVNQGLAEPTQVNFLRVVSSYHRIALIEQLTSIAEAAFPFTIDSVYYIPRQRSSLSLRSW